MRSLSLFLGCVNANPKRFLSVFTRNMDSERLLLEKLRVTISVDRSKVLEEKFLEGIQANERFCVNTDCKDERQFLHILAHLNGWYSRKENRRIELSDHAILCEKCHVYI